MAHAMVSPVLIGRTYEIDRLEQAMRTAAKGIGRMVLVSGEAGLGKSRLLEAVEQRAAAGWMVLRGRCFEQEISFPYSPWIDMLRQFISLQGWGTGRTSTAPEDRSNIPGSLPAVLAQLLPELQFYVPAENQPAILDPESEKRLLFNAVLAWIVQEARNRPVLIEMEDIHWSDEASLDLLRFVIRHIQQIPVIILATYRSDEVRPALAAFLAEMDRERQVEEIQVPPLTRPEVEQLICQLLGLPLGSRLNFPEPVVAWMEGNPFYVEEILQALPDAGSLAGWNGQDFEKLAVPRSVQAMVQQRAAGLSDEARGLLTLASVIGQQFEGRLLAGLGQVDEAEFLRLIRELIGAQFIVESDDSPGDIYAFRHALTREAIYSTLLGVEKRLLTCGLPRPWKPFLRPSCARLIRTAWRTWRIISMRLPAGPRRLTTLARPASARKRCMPLARRLSILRARLTLRDSSIAPRR